MGLGKEAYVGQFLRWPSNSMWGRVARCTWTTVSVGGHPQNANRSHALVCGATRHMLWQGKKTHGPSCGVAPLMGDSAPEWWQM